MTKEEIKSHMEVCSNAPAYKADLATCNREAADKAELYMLSDRYQEAIDYLRENEPRPTAN